MDKTTKGTLIVLSILIVASILLTYHRTIIRKDYTAFPPESEEEMVPLEESASLEVSPDAEFIPSQESTSTTP